MENKNELIQVPAGASKEVVLKAEGAIGIQTFDKEVIKNRIQAIKSIAETIKAELVDGVDYGLIPGTGKKPTLFKAGAQKLTLMYGLLARYTQTLREVDYDEGTHTFAYNVVLGLLDENKNYVELYEGSGECSSKEKGKTTQPANTILKMAKKRSLVDAVVSIGNLGEVFTQDMEDMTLSTHNVNSLTKDDKLNLYSMAYTHWADMINDAKTKVEGKTKVKARITELFTEWGFTARHFLHRDFGTEQRDKFMEYINGGGY